MLETRKFSYSRLVKRVGSKWYAILVFVVIGAAVTGTLVALSAFFAVSHAENLFSRTLCFKSECLDKTARILATPYFIIQATISLLVAIATIGGIFVALSNYLATAGATAFGNHISHLSVFREYVNAEVAKRDRVSSGSLDVFRWYRLIFPEAGIGRLSVSSEYENIVAALNKEIIASNDQAQKATGGSFRYVPHQERMVAALSKFGIVVHRQPRVAYFEIEDEVLSLIRAVNFAFCKGSSACGVTIRDYR